MVNLWPAVGRTVLGENGAVIPVNGITIASIDEYYAPLVASQSLLTYDPLNGPTPPNVVGQTQPVLAVDTDAILATLRGYRDRAQARTTGATAPNAGDGDTWNWSDSSTATPGVDVLAPDPLVAGRWLRDTSSGGGTLAGDVTGPSAGNNVVKLRTTSFDASVPVTGNILRQSSTAGHLATGQMQFPAVSGSIAVGALIRVAGLIAGAALDRIWTVTSVQGLSGGQYTVTVSGPGAGGNANAGTTSVRLLNPPTAVGTITAVMPGVTTNIPMTFTGTPGTSLPIGTLIKLTSGGAANWTVTFGGTVPAGGSITVFCSGPVLDTGTSVDLNTPIAGITTTGAVSTKVTGTVVSMTFTGTPTTLIPSGTLIKLTSGGPASWTTTANATVSGGGTATVTCSGPVLATGTSVDLNTPIAGITTAGSVFGSAPGPTLRIQGSDNSLAWTVNADATVIGGVVTLDLSGPGIPTGQAVEFTAVTSNTNGVSLTGTCTLGAGLYATGVVIAPGITGGTDLWTAVAKDITQPRVHEIRTLANGDARKGVFAGTGADSTLAIQTLINSMVPGDKLHWDAEYAVTNIYVDKGQYPLCRNITIFGDDDYETSDPVSSMRYIGPNGGTLLRVASDRCTFRGLQLVPHTSGFVPVSLHDLDWGSVGTPNGNFNAYENLYYNNPSSTTASHIRFAPSNRPIGGWENNQWKRCRFQNILTYSVDVGAGVQPYSTHFVQCTWFGGSNLAPRGIVLFNHNVSSSFKFDGCDVQQVEAWIYATQGCSIAISDSQMEIYKKIFYVPAGLGVSLTIQGGERFGDGGIALASAGPFNFPATDHALGVFNASGVCKLDGVNISGSAVEYPNARIALGPLAVGSFSGIFSSRTVFYRAVQPNPGASTRVDDAFCLPGSNSQFDEMQAGSENTNGEFTVYESATQQIIALPNMESTANAPVTVTPIGSIGSPAADSAAVTEVSLIAGSTASSLTVKLKAAPGAGAGRRFRWNFGGAKARRVITTPTDFGTPRLWLKSSGLAGGATVTTWTDANGLVFVPGPNAPVYVASSGNLNGLATAKFQAGAAQTLLSNLAASAWADISDGRSVTMIAIVYHPSASSTDALGSVMGTKTIGVGRGVGFAMDWQPGPLFARQFPVIGDGTTGTGIGQNAYTAGKRMWYARVTGANGPGLGKSSCEAHLWIETASFGALNLSAGTPQSTFFMQNQSTTQDLEIAEVLILNRALTNAEGEALLQGYFVPRYAGLTSP